MQSKLIFLYTRAATEITNRCSNKEKKKDVIKIETVIFTLCNLSVNNEKQTLLAYQNIDKDRKNIYLYI